MKRLIDLLLIASFIFIIVSCGSSKDVGDTYHGTGLVEREKTLVMDNVEDKDRMTKMLIVIDEEGDLLNNFESTQKDHLKQFMKIMDDYNSSEEEIAATVMDFHTQFKLLVLSMLEKNAELKAQASSEEWEDISKWKKENIFKK
jgi:hypothetical protein